MQGGGAAGAAETAGAEAPAIGADAELVLPPVLVDMAARKRCALLSVVVTVPSMISLAVTPDFLPLAGAVPAEPENVGVFLLIEDPFTGAASVSAGAVTPTGGVVTTGGVVSTGGAAAASSGSACASAGAVREAACPERE